MGVGRFGRRAEKHAWESVERSQIEHPSGYSSRSDRVLIKLDASIAEKKTFISMSHVAEVYVWLSYVRVIVIFLFGLKISILFYINYFLVK